MNKNILLRDGELSRPKAVAAAIFPQGGEQACETSLAELERLLDTAGAEKFSRFLGEWFNGNLTVQPRPGQNSQLWQSRLDYILKLLEKPMTVK